MLTRTTAHRSTCARCISSGHGCSAPGKEQPRIGQLGVHTGDTGELTRYAETANRYTVCFKTSYLVGADTDSRVEIQLRGSLSTSPYLGPLDDPNRDDFEIGHTDCFGPFLPADHRRRDPRHPRRIPRQTV